MLPVSGGVDFNQRGRSSGSISQRGMSNYGFYSGSGIGGGGISTTRTTVDELSALVAGDVNGGWDLESDKQDMEAGRDMLESDDEAFLDLDRIFDGRQNASEIAPQQASRVDGPRLRSKAERSSFSGFTTAASRSSVFKKLSGGFQQNLRSASQQPWAGRANRYYNGAAYYTGAEYVNWVSQLFPGLPGVVPPQKTAVESTWPDDALAISNSLLRKDALAELTVSLEIRSTAEVFDARWGGTTPGSPGNN